MALARLTKIRGIDAGRRHAGVSAAARTPGARDPSPALALRAFDLAAAFAFETLARGLIGVDLFLLGSHGPAAGCRKQGGNDKQGAKDGANRRRRSFHHASILQQIIYIVNDGRYCLLEDPNQTIAPDRLVFYTYSMQGPLRIVYFIKAMYSGRFTWMPTVAQGMYHPQYFGRTAIRQVEVRE